MYGKQFGVIILLLISGLTFGQVKSDTIYTMKEVVVKTNRLKDLSVGSSIQRLSPIEMKANSGSNLGELLTSNSQVFIKAYGPGGLASPSIRGGAAQHTSVIWNGVSINSPMNGGVDLSLLPVGFIDDVSVQYGGSGTLYGSGAVSGIIHLNSTDLLKGENNFKVRGGLGSFNTKNAYTSLKIGNENIATSLKYYGNFTDNDFEYTQADDTKATQTNAGLKQHAISNEIQIKTSDNSYLKSTIWYQYHDKEVQTLMNATAPSEATQENKNLRAALNWYLKGKDYSFTYKSVLLRDKNLYLNPAWATETLNEATSIIEEAELKLLLGKNQVLIGGANFTYQKAESPNYTDEASRKNFSLFMSHKFINLFDRLTIVNSIRQQMADSEILPIVFSSGFNLGITDEFGVNANISRTYNLPGLNDLFWATTAWTAGNPDLEAEYGWSGDFGLEQNFSIGEVNFNLKENYFFNNLNDWIVWLPDNNFVWKPENKNKGRSNGFDIHLNMNTKLGSTLVEFAMNYTYTSSNFEEEVNGEIVETPMLYVPENQFMFNFHVSQNNWSCSYNHSFMGERIYNVDEDPLISYNVGNLVVMYQLPFDNNKLSAAFKLNNIWNSDYQVINNYAMPGRYWNFSLTYDLSF